MHKEVAKLWIGALRSGEYKQGHGVLKDAFGHYCCLGVLCDLYQKGEGNGQWVAMPTGTPRFVIDSTDSSFSILPDAVRDWAGLKENEPTLPVERAMLGLESKRPPLYEPAASNALTKHNDCGTTFDEIAGFIEEYQDAI